MTTEREVLAALSALCSSPGYVQALALLCLRDNVIRFPESISGSDLSNMYSRERLVRTEQSTLIGLLIKNPSLDTTMPSHDQLHEYIENTQGLLERLHEIIGRPLSDSIQHLHRDDYNPLASGDALREAMFYSGETAYALQYVDLLIRKYGRDNRWLRKHKGFSIDEATEVFQAIRHSADDEVQRLHEMFRLPEDQQKPLSLLTIRVADLVRTSRLSETIVRNVLTAFSVELSDSCNQEFNSINDFNLANAAPLIPMSAGNEFILFNLNALAEAMYASPYYWMMADNGYKDTAASNRGRFAEDFVYERLSHVFGSEGVYKNVTISSRGETLGEIDILVVYCNQILLAQVKSKQLTLEARRGNDNQIRNDFKKSTQDAYDQAASCARYIEDSDSYVLSAGNSQDVDLGSGVLDIYPICVVSDHYPALSAQVRQFLKYTTTEALWPPIVVDVFMLDTTTEMLESPVEFLSYLKLRAEHVDRIVAHNELTILSFHLQRNLMLDQSFDVLYMDDDISMELDAAMLVRRHGAPGNDFVEGFLSRFRNTALGRILRSLEHQRDSDTIELAFMLLRISEGSVNDLSANIDKITNLTNNDGRNHDVSIYFGDLYTGLTVHCNSDSTTDASRRLIEHCERRKYSQKATKWFGICISKDLKVRYGLRLQGSWAYSANMEQKVRELDQRIVTGQRRVVGRVGRNDPCPCGSGRKHKHCCLR